MKKIIKVLIVIVILCIITSFIDYYRVSSLKKEPIFSIKVHNEFSETDNNYSYKEKYIGFGLSYEIYMTKNKNTNALVTDTKKHMVYDKIRLFGILLESEVS